MMNMGAGRWMVLGLVCCLIASAGASVRENGGTQLIMEPDVPWGYASTHIVIKLRPGMSHNGVAMISEDIDALNKAWGVLEVRPFYTADFGPFGNPELAAELGLDRNFLFYVPQGTNTPAMAAEYAQLVDEIEAAEFESIGGVAQYFPNDPEFSKLWGLHNPGGGGGIADADIDAPEAWTIHTGNYGTVTIAIIDSGVNPHVDFGDRLIPGINTNNPNTPNLTTDGCPHGTHVAGTAAAGGDNGIGVAGVTWGAYIMPIRVLNGCNGTPAQCAAGVVWATDNGADVATMSLQYYTNVSAFQDAINYAWASGLFVDAATGNNNSVIAWPAKYTNCVGVGATTKSDTKAGFSNQGPEIELSAPGVQIYSTWTNNGYTYNDGTSMAAPHVAGLAALMWSFNPTLSNDAIREILKNTADDVAAPGWDQQTGFGRINAYEALLASGGEFVQIASSNPPHLAIDARQPFKPDGSEVSGWQDIEFTLTGEIDDVAALNFKINVKGPGESSPPAVASVVQSGPDSVVLSLSKPLNLLSWTTITLNGTQVKLGYLPGDVDGNTITKPDDILAIVNALNGVVPLPVYSTDINRDNLVNAADVLRLIDLINGAGEYPEYLNHRLPQ